MRFSTSIAAVALAALANCQSPAGFTPLTNSSLIVRYGNVSVVANQSLPTTAIQTRPSVSLNSTHNGTFMVAFVDLDISAASAHNATNLTLVPGLGANRTTRLHWLQTGLTQLPNGTFSSNTTAVAPYGAPMPPAGDIPHVYTFYLFPQTANFTLPGIDAGRNYTNVSTTARVDFDVAAIASAVGAPLAANYYRVQNNGTTTTVNVTTTYTSTLAGGAKTTVTSTTAVASVVGTTTGTAASTSAAAGSSTTSSRAGAATNFAAAGLMGLVGAVAFL